jgi:DNA adenine methylase
MGACYAISPYDALANWRRVERNAFADGARARTEVLWMNYEPEDLFAEVKTKA